MKIKYLTLEQILGIHYQVMAKFGEKEEAGVMFKDALLSAVVRSQFEYFGQELFPSLWEKSGALLQAIMQNHVFNNGNKRTAFAATNMFLFINGYRLYMNETTAEEFVISIVTEPLFKGQDGVKKIALIIEQYAGKI